MTSLDIRRQFLDFFVQKHGHAFVPSSPVVPHDDPTLLFTNAGMNQFKPIFLGQETRAYVRAANTQKCIRAGGKHNDLDDVGRSRRHHTFFEMLGNWSFGDYFKRGAIEMAWELLTQVWKIDPTRLHVSCCEGDAAGGVPRDTEAAGLWKEIAGLADDHIHYFGKDNFWEMGETGPCGPCTEIYIDRTPDKSGGPQVNGDDPRVMEIWNLVFIQYNRNADRTLSPLPHRHVDTGMGFERICQVLQDKSDNYAIDLWEPYFAALSEMTGLKYTGQFPATNAADPAAESANPQLRYDIAFRVIADHVRCLTFALTDGAVPSNEGRGYVLRRILRRAVRFGRQHLNLKEPFLHTLVPVVVQTMGEAFPELKQNFRGIAQVIQDEEVSFGRTLDRGIALFDEAAGRAGNEAQIPARDAFQLHDTYGFPIDLTQIMAQERGMSVDIEGYEKLMEQARQLARTGGKGTEAAVFELPPHVVAALNGRGVKPTEDRAKYAGEPIQATVAAIWDGFDLRDAVDADDTPGAQVAVILDRTNFYAEMGGQVGDNGEIVFGEGKKFEVQSTRIVAGYVLHIGQVQSGRLNVGDAAEGRVSALRHRTQNNHTSTHLANWALREVLGEGVEQKGSLVDPDKLRFDFSQPKSLEDGQIARVEELVNAAIGRGLRVYAQEAPQEAALKINGLRAVFGEKYPPLVRVVSVGVPVDELLKDPSNEKWRAYSIEFCGGTHLGDSAEAQAFAVTAEESVSKGIRRIVAVTGEPAQRALAAAQTLDGAIEKAKQTPDAELSGQVAAIQKFMTEGTLPLLARRRAQAAIGQLQGRLKAFEKSSAASGPQLDVQALSAQLLQQAESSGGGTIVVTAIAGADDNQLRSLIDSLRKKAPSHGLLLASAGESKVSFVSAVSDDLVAKGLKAGDWVREAAKVAGGGGGGRPQMAQAGGKDPSKLNDALEAARAWARKQLQG
jgi:alanyl-tRNA synthetase